MNAADPQLSIIVPRGAQRGTEQVFRFAGARLDDAEQILFYEPGFEVLEIKDEILTKEVSAFKGSEVEKCGNYLIIPSVPEIHPSAALPYGRFFKAKVFKQNKKLVYHNPYTGAEHLVSESNHTFVKV